MTPAPKRPSVGMSRKANEPNNARTIAHLQALTLALHIGGLEGFRTGAVRTATTDDSGSPQ
jgi:hypothetical protein